MHETVGYSRVATPTAAPARSVAVRSSLTPFATPGMAARTTVRTTSWAAVVLALLASSTLALMVAAAPAHAQDTEEQLAAEGYVVEDGADDVDESRLASTIEDARRDGVELSAAFLADAPEGAEAAADSLVEGLGGVVLVVTPDEIGASGEEYSSADIDAALDAAADELGADDDPVDAVAAFASELGEGTAMDGFDTSQLPGPLAGMSPTTLILGAIAILVVFALLRRLLGGGRRRRRYQGGMHEPGYGGYRGGYGSRRRGGMGGGLVGGLLGGAIGGRMARGRGDTNGSVRRSAGTRTGRSGGSAGRSSGSRNSRSRSSGSRSSGSRSSGSRSRSSGRSRGSGSRRR